MMLRLKSSQLELSLLMLCTLLIGCTASSVMSAQAITATPVPTATPADSVEVAALEPIVPGIEVAPEPAGSPRQATLTAQAGRVEVHRSNNSGYESLTTGQSVSVSTGDVIRTGSDGTASLSFEANTETTIFPNTVLVVDSFTQDSSGALDVRLLLLIGETFNDVNFTNRNSRQQLATPYGVASVRGTNYWTEVTIGSTYASMLLTQTLDAFQTQIADLGLTGDLRTLAWLVAELLGTSPGDVQIDVTDGSLEFVDPLGDVVIVNTCVSALAVVDASGMPDSVETMVSDLCEGGTEGFCGDGVCDLSEGESRTSCRVDCGPGISFCGDGVCDASLGETVATCRVDCGTVSRFCGDGVCDPYLGETLATCRVDCGTASRFCGDGVCDPYFGETAASCRVDCG